MPKRKTAARSVAVREMLQVPVPAGTKAALQARFPGRRIADLVREAMAAHLEMPALAEIRPPGRPWPAKEA